MNIKLHLDAAESDPVIRLAEALQVDPEDVVYAALNRLMMHARESETQDEIVLTRFSRANNRPLWADTADWVHHYEGMTPGEPDKGKYFV